MPEAPDVIVVGGGIVGRIAALRLAWSGRAVTLIDAPSEDLPALASPASFGNAGHIAIEQVRPLTNPAFLRSVPRRLFAVGGVLDVGWRHPGLWLPWSLQAALACGRARQGQTALTALLAGAGPAWQRLVSDLRRPELLIERGHLMLWQRPRAGAAGVAAWQGAATGAATVHPLDQAGLDRAARHLRTRPCAGLRVEGTSQVSDPGEVMASVLRAFQVAGGIQLTSRVRALRPGHGQTMVELESQTLQAPQVLLTAGVGSRRLLHGLGLTLPLIAERGYHIEWTHGAEYDLPPMVFEERSLIVTRFGNRLRASSFVEFTYEHAPADARKWQRLERHVAELGLPVAGAFRRWLGARPTLPDYLPAIGASSASPGLFLACGHQHLGLTLAPRTAEMLLRLMDGQPLTASPDPLDTHPFNPERFGVHQLRHRELDPAS